MSGWKKFLVIGGSYSHNGPSSGWLLPLRWLYATTLTLGMLMIPPFCLMLFPLWFLAGSITSSPSLDWQTCLLALGMSWLVVGGLMAGDTYYWVKGLDVPEPGWVD